MKTKKRGNTEKINEVLERTSFGQDFQKKI